MSGGTETRAQILPSAAPQDTGFLLPPYDFTANLATPKQAGVTKGGRLSDVANAASGIIYYTDVIGFGESSNRMTKGKKFQHLGINFFMKSGLNCSNGADMWTYFKGIPEGNALGNSVKKAMAEMGMPALRGLAPGILEDSQSALNIGPVINAAFGSVYPVCELKTMPVGDERGQLQDPQTGDVWVTGPVEYRNGIPHQTRWMQKTNARGDNPVFVDQKTFQNTPKTQNPDGTPATKAKEGFQDTRKTSLVLALIFLCGATAILCRKR